jgi:O-acetyl-ADP-ribose deacetylase (regulator of RNase III)
MPEQVQVIFGDITKQAVDAIVNAANSTLQGGGGVDGAIHREAGPHLVWECRKLGGCPTGGAKITKGYYLPAKHVIHAVGPIWQGGTAGEEELLARTYRSVFELVAQHSIRSLAFPSISTGAYRFPLERAARIAIRETRVFLECHHPFTEVRFICLERETYDQYVAAVAEVMGKPSTGG